MDQGASIGVRVMVVIPARGGSKGIPRKNLQRVGGAPLVARAVAVARQSAFRPRVIVSTDDPEIAAVAARAGAEIIMRPAEISGDTASSESAIMHALDNIGPSEASPDIVVLLQCTSPFTTAEDIDGTIRLVAECGADSAFTTVPFHHFVWKIGESGAAEGVSHCGGPRKRRQDMESQYLEAGSVYAMRVTSFRSEGHRFCGRSLMYVSEAARCHEIDDETDLKIARAIATVVETESKTVNLPRQISCVVFDFDGVLTDNAVIVSQGGVESVRCSRSDGMGIEMLRQLEVPMLVLSKERNEVVLSRCAKLGIPCIQAVDRKLDRLMQWLADEAINPEGVVYVGNDINDLDCLKYAAFAVGPSDSHPDILDALDLRLSQPGGAGAVRELSDLITSGIKTGSISLLPRSNGQISSCRKNRYSIGEHDERPWGDWQVLAVGDEWCLKRIMVKPNEELSLQLHNYRDEVWVVCEGIASVTLDGQSSELLPGQSVLIKRGVSHRLSNKAQDCPLIIVELQLGSDLDEADIIRLEDKYGRS